jgi:hypothetical protein
VTVDDDDDDDDLDPELLLLLLELVDANGGRGWNVSAGCLPKRMTGRLMR